MKIEEILSYLREQPNEDLSPDELLLHLLQQGKISVAEYLQYGDEILRVVKPVLNVPEDCTFDADKWLEYSKHQPMKLEKSEVINLNHCKWEILDEEKAKEIAINFIGNENIKEIESKGLSENGNIPSYSFSITLHNENNKKVISISKTGRTYSIYKF